MNYNKVNVISNELSNTKEFLPLGDVHITQELTVDDLRQLIFQLKEDTLRTSNSLATYKKSVKEAFKVLQEKFDLLSNTIETNKTATTAELTNIKEAIKLLGGVL